MLRPDSQNRLTFDLTVDGTSSMPSSVRVILGEPGLMFKAIHESGSTWACDLLLPALAGPTIPLKVEAVVNGRLFTPLNVQMDLEQSPPKQEEPKIETPVQVEPPAPEPVPEIKAPIAKPVPPKGTVRPEFKAPPKPQAVKSKDTRSVFAMVNEIVSKNDPKPEPKIERKEPPVVIEAAPARLSVTLTKGTIVYR